MTGGSTIKPGGPRQQRYDLEPVWVFVASALELSRRSGADPREIQRWKKSGSIPDRWADRVAVGLGLHPAELWPEWIDVQVRALPCRGCDATFPDEGTRRQFHSKQCYRRWYSRKRRAAQTPQQRADERQAMAEYRRLSKKAQGIYNRRWYERTKAEDPEYWRRYYADNAAVRSAQERARYWRRKGDEERVARELAYVESLRRNGKTVDIKDAKNVVVHPLDDHRTARSPQGPTMKLSPARETTAA